MSCSQSLVSSASRGCIRSGGVGQLVHHEASAGFRGPGHRESRLGLVPSCHQDRRASHRPGKRRRSIASPCRPHHPAEQLQSYRDGCCAQRHPVVTVEHRSRSKRGGQPSGRAATSLPWLCDGPPVRDVTHVSARARMLKAHPRNIYIKVDEVRRLLFVLVIFISSSRAKLFTLFSSLTCIPLPSVLSVFLPNIRSTTVATMVTTLDSMLSCCLLVWGLLLSTAAALVTPQSRPEMGGLVRRQSCNTASNRQCWTSSPAFNINTDYETSRPSTGVTRTVGLPLIMLSLAGLTDFLVYLHSHTDPYLVWWRRSDQEQRHADQR